MSLRIALITKLPGDNKGLKTFIQQFLFKLKIASEVERIMEDGVYATHVRIEGIEGTIHSGKQILIQALQREFPNLDVSSEWIP